MHCGTAGLREDAWRHSRKQVAEIVFEPHLTPLTLQGSPFVLAQGDLRVMGSATAVFRYLLQCSGFYISMASSP